MEGDSGEGEKKKGKGCAKEGGQIRQTWTYL